jgi:hypothetical protein
MSVVYPRTRVEKVLRPLHLASAHRILWKHCLAMPLTARSSKSRFCDGHSYAVLYGAGDFETAFVEVVVRDRFVQRDRRTVNFGELANRGWVKFTLRGERPLNMVDIRESGCVTLGAPTDAAHSRNQAAGRALSRALHDQHSDVDGIWYRSRLTGGDCLAIFDRSLQHLASQERGELKDHPALPGVLRLHRIGIEK